MPSAHEQTKLGSSNREASSSAGKNTEVVVMSHMEVSTYSYFQWCGYFSGSWASLVTTDEFSVKVTKITSKINVS